MAEISDFLNAAFGACADHVVLACGDTENVVASADDLQRVIDLSVDLGEPIYLFPVSAAGRVPFLYAVMQDAEPDQWQDLTIAPTAVLHRDGTLINVWALTEPVPRDQLTIDLAVSMDAALDEPIPTPGANGWELLHCNDNVSCTFEALADVYGASAPAAAVEAAPWEEQEIGDYGELLDARILTPLDLNDPIYQQEMVISIGANRKSMKWRRDPMPIGKCFGILAVHPEDKRKDGPAFVLADIIGPQRTKTAVKAIYAVGLDIDVGVPLAEIDRALAKLGRTAVRYTTHSHLKSTTKFVKDAILKKMKVSALDTEVVRRYLREEKRWVEQMVQSVEYTNDEHEPEGLMAVVSHDPMPKSRVIVPFAVPFEPAKVARSHAEGLAMWNKVVPALSRMLGLELAFDRSAVDPSRLFYFPRHAPGRPHDTALFGGGLADWHEFDLDGRPADPFEAALEAEVSGKGSGGSRSTSPEGRALGRWSIKAAAGFQIAEVIRDHAPDRIRTNGSQKIDIECPFDEEHSNPGDPEDRGCFAVNAGDGPSEIFTIHCQHDSCAERTNLDHLGKMQKDGWFAEEVLEDPSYNAVSDDGTQRWPEGNRVAEEDEARQEYAALIDALSPESSEEEVEAALETLTKANLSGLAKSRWEGKAKAKLKVNQATFTAIMKGVKRDVASQRNKGGNVRTGRSDPEFPLPSGAFGTLCYVDFEGMPFFGREDDKMGATPLVAPFEVTGAALYPDRDNLRDVEVAFRNEFGVREIVRIPADIIPRRETVIALLRGRGMRFAHARDGTELVHQILMATQPEPRTLYDRPGWAPGGGFILPTGVVVGADHSQVGLSDRVRIDAPATMGTFDAWRAGAMVAWNSKSLSLKAALAAGFAGPLLALAGRGALVIEFGGPTTGGKTWRQQVGVAVSGTPKPGVGQMRSLNSTDNALEAPLARGSSTITAYDEVAFAAAATVQRLIFLAAGEQGKARLSRDGSEASMRSWRGGVVTLSTEVGLAQLLRQEGERQTGGMTVRMITVDVESDELSEQEFTAANAMLHNYGHGLPVYLEHVIRAGYADDPARLSKRAEELIRDLPGVGATKGKNSAPAHRAALGLGFLGVAAEIAKAAGCAPANLDVPAMMRGLWEGTQASGNAAVDPVDRAIAQLIETINARWGTEVYDVTAQEEKLHPRDPSREIKCWVDTLDGARVYFVRESVLGEWSGGAVPVRTLVKKLRDSGQAIPEKGDAKKATIWNGWRRPVGRTRVIVLKASAVEHGEGGI